VAAPTLEDERDRLAAHPRLLTPEADVAVAEALLRVPQPLEVNRLEAVRRAAATHGAASAYGHLVHAVLAEEFVQASPARQRTMLRRTRGELLDLRGRLPDTSEAVARGRAAALLDLAADDAHEPVLDALEDPQAFPEVLHEAALDASMRRLQAVVTVAESVAETRDDHAVAGFYRAIVEAVDGGSERAGETLRAARRRARRDDVRWYRLLAEIAQVHPGALPLFAVLAKPRPTEVRDGAH